MLVGIAGAQAELAVALRPSAERWAVAHDAAGVATLVARLQVLRPVWRGLEATGGLEVLVPGALAAAEWPVGVVNPRPARDFAKATGPWAKTAGWDARAHVAEAVRPALRPVPEAHARALSAQLTRRRPLVERLTAEKHRIARVPGAIRAEIQGPSRWWEPRRADLDTDLGRAIRATPLWREHDERWHRTPGGARALPHAVGRSAGAGPPAPSAACGRGRCRPPQPG
jgi:transposase